MHPPSGPGWLVWLETSAVAVAMRQWAWLYPIVEIAHIVGFVTLVGAALMDRDVFPDPNRFDFGRAAEPYLHFGDTQPGSALHRCLGQQLATAELRELVKAVFSLKGLRRAAGRAGEKLEEQLLASALTIRFDPT